MFFLKDRISAKSYFFIVLYLISYFLVLLIIEIITEK